MHVMRTIRVKSYNEAIQQRYRICHIIVSYTLSIQYGYHNSSNRIIYNKNITIDSSNLLLGENEEETLNTYIEVLKLRKLS